VHEDGESNRSLSARLVRLAQHRRLQGVAAKIVTALAIAGLVVGVVVAVTQLPDLDESVRPSLLAGAVCLAAVSFLNNAVEYWWISRRVGIDIEPLAAVRVSLKSTAANALPLPGAAIVKFEALYRQGARARRAVALITAVTVMVIGIAFLLTGVIAVLGDAGDTVVWAVVLIALGLAAIGVSSVLIRSAQTSHSWRAIGAAALIESASVVLAGLRMELIVTGLGFHVSLTQAFALSLAGIAAVAVGIAPSGLGVREGLAALFGNISGQSASVSVVASAIDRLVTYVALALLGVAVVAAPWAANRRRKRDAAQTGSAT
jgi:uncharacterized membrane protein YbhN (UPF0104 family)